MIKWTKLPRTEYFTQDSDLIYIIPCEEGIKILYNNAYCLIENMTVQEMMDNIKALACPSYGCIEEIKKMIEEIEKEKPNEEM